MAIIDVKPTELKMAQAKTKIKGGIEAAVNTLQQNLSALMSAFWLNPELTPQQMSDAFGTDAAQLFILMGKAQAFINDVRPGSYIQAPTRPFVINQDGTVTIS